MEIITAVLDFVKNLLGFLNEGEAAGIVGIVKDFVGGLSFESIAGLIDGIKGLF